MTERFEGLNLSAYQDVVGVWTIGYGHTGPEVIPGLTITQEQAEAYLQEDIADTVDAVNGLVHANLTQSQFDALVDFVFNLGRKNFATSTLLQKLNAGDYDGAADEFEKWSHAGGKLVAGLLRRRREEREQFEV
jgi:lysozyme